jgi:hypothetical protein
VPQPALITSLIERVLYLIVAVAMNLNQIQLAHPTDKQYQLVKLVILAK